MKLLGILVGLGALCTLFAFSEANAISKENEKPCCPKTDVDGNPFKDDVLCMTLKEFVAFRGKEISDEIDKTPRIKRTPELELQIKINAFSKAAGQCIPNNQAYRSAHLTLDDLHTIIDKFPTLRNVQKKISEAQEVMDNLFDRLRHSQNEAGSKLPQKLRDEIDNFFKESVERAIKVFNYTLEKAKVVRKVFEQVELMPEIDKIIDKVEGCMGVDTKDYEGTFKCHEQVRLQASELYDKMRNLRTMGRMKLTPPKDTIERLIVDVTEGVRSLEVLLVNYKLAEEFVGDYKGFMV